MKKGPISPLERVSIPLLITYNPAAISGGS